MTKKFSAYKADSFDDEMIESHILYMVDDLPKSKKFDLKVWQEFYEVQARVVYVALQALPQGTRFELVKLFLENSKNLYRGI